MRSRSTRATVASEGGADLGTTEIVAALLSELTLGGETEATSLSLEMSDESFARSAWSVLLPGSSAATMIGPLTPWPKPLATRS